MSMLEGLSSTVAEMGFVQLMLVFVAVAAYSLAINGSFSAAARSGAASTSFVASAAFSALTPSWVSGVIFLASAVLGIALFAGAALCVSALLGLGTERGDIAAPVAEEEPVPARWPLPQAMRALVPNVIRALR